MVQINDEMDASEEETDADIKQHRVPLPSVPSIPSVVPLAHLVDIVVQKVYSDLTILSELLPKKSDVERKIDIVRFAYTTRQRFVRLLAVVKWAKNSDIVDTCDAISYFLSQQAGLFAETADSLFEMAREKLTGARLPTFQVPAAVDVLTLGTYPRLPAVIKNRFVPEPAITSKEQVSILGRLNQVIGHRLLSSAYPLPAKMRDVVIRNGMAVFTVPGEFEACLTLLGELPNTPWTVLNLRILVKDGTKGVCQGSELVHPLQVFYVHQLVQGRLNTEDKQPIVELYTVLHGFCVSLQLEMLMCQANRLIQERRGGDNLRLQCDPGNKLILSYWTKFRDHQAQTTGGPGPSETGRPGSMAYKLEIHVADESPMLPLQTLHSPTAAVSLPVLCTSRSLDIEVLLMDTILVRIKQRLERLNSHLQDMGVKSHFQSSPSPNYIAVAGVDDDDDVPCAATAAAHPPASTSPYPVVRCDVVEDSAVHESVNISIHSFSGRFVCKVPKLSKPSHFGSRCESQLRFALDEPNWPVVKSIFQQIKIALLVERCSKITHNLSAKVCSAQNFIPDSPCFSNLASDRVYLRFSRFPNYYLIIEFIKNDDLKVAPSIHYHVMETRLVDAQEYFKPGEAASLPEGIPLLSGVSKLIKPSTLIQVDMGTLGAPNYGLGGLKSMKTEISGRSSHKRRREMPSHPSFVSGADGPPSGKRFRVERTSVSDIPYVISQCEQRIAFLLLTKELKKRGIQFQPAQIEPETSTFVLKIISITAVPGCPDDVFRQFWSNVVSCTARICQDRVYAYTIELLFAQNPLLSSSDSGDFVAGKERKLYHSRLSPDTIGPTLDEFLSQLSLHATLFKPALDFAPYYHNILRPAVQVRTSNWFRFVIGYGPRHTYTVLVDWRQKAVIPPAPGNLNVPSEQSPSSIGPRYNLVFGSHGMSISNPHSMLNQTLNLEFNQRPDLTKLMTLLSETIQPLLSISLLNTRPFIIGRQDTMAPRDYRMHQTFTVIPVSITVFRLVYRECFCVEIQCLANGQVALLDVGGVFHTAKASGSGAHAQPNLLGQFMPLLGIKSFVAKYIYDFPHSIGGTATTHSGPPSHPPGLATSHDYLTKQPPSVSGTMGGPASVGSIGTPQPLTAGAFMGGTGTSMSGGFNAPAPTSHPSVTMGSPFPQPVSVGPPTGYSASQPATPVSPMKGMNPGSIQAASPATFPPLSSPASQVAPSPLPSSSLPPPPSTTVAPSPSTNAGNISFGGGSSSNVGPLTPHLDHNLSSASSAGLMSPSPAQVYSMMGAGNHPGTGNTPTCGSAAGMGGMQGPGSNIAGDFMCASSWGDGGQLSSCMSNPPSVQPMSVGQMAGSVTPSSGSQQVDWTMANKPFVLSCPCLDNLLTGGATNPFSGKIISALDKRIPGPFERFCGCLYLMTKMERVLAKLKNPNIMNLQKNRNAPFTLNFTCSCFSCSMYIDESTLSSIRFSVGLADNTQYYSPDELTVIERYFTNVVVGTGFRETRVSNFIQLLSLGKAVRPDLLKNFLEIMRSEMGPRQNGVEWDVALLWIVPPSFMMGVQTNNLFPGGQSVSIDHNTNKMLFWLRFINVNNPSLQICLPFLYFFVPNELKVFYTDPVQIQTVLPQRVNELTDKWTKLYMSAAQSDPNNPEPRCLIWRAVEDIMMNLNAGPQ